MSTISETAADVRREQAEHALQRMIWACERFKSAKRRGNEAEAERELRAIDDAWDAVKAYGR